METLIWENVINVPAEWKKDDGKSYTQNSDAFILTLKHWQTAFLVKDNSYLTGI